VKTTPKIIPMAMTAKKGTNLWRTKNLISETQYVALPITFRVTESGIAIV
jgi:hypothetical protein